MEIFIHLSLVKTVQNLFNHAVKVWSRFVERQMPRFLDHRVVIRVTFSRWVLVRTPFI